MRRAKTRPVMLPCGHMETARMNPENDVIRVRRGDIGICVECGLWWECFGLPYERMKYVPAEEDINMLWCQIEALLERENKRRN